MPETDEDGPDWFERRAKRLEDGQWLRCVEHPPTDDDQVNAEKIVTNRIQELRELSETYGKH